MANLSETLMMELAHETDAPSEAGAALEVFSRSPSGAHPRSALEVAMYTFGDLSTAEAWMREPHAHLIGSPEHACRHAAGLERVLQLLSAIANGTEP